MTESDYKYCKFSFVTPNVVMNLIADGVAMIVAAALTIHYFKKLKIRNSECEINN